MEITLARALVAAARAFADELERGLAPDTVLSPIKGSAQSMHEVLRSVAGINDRQARGVSDEEIRAIARRAGMDPRGMAGYYAASLLEKRDDGTRWVSPGGRDRLLALHQALLMGAPVAEEANRLRGVESPEHFDALYTDGSPPWDIGRPQPAFLHLAQAGALRGRVLDIGCGTGEHALMAAAMGLAVTGIDSSPTAIRRAESKAAERKLEVRFRVWNALELPALGEQFETVLDSGLFHVFDDADRSHYVDSLRAVVAPEGRCYVLCFSDRMPGTIGPRRVSQDEIRASFADGWRVESIEPAIFETTFAPHGAVAWLAAITRVAEPEKAPAR